jgi:hypothetical protein
LAFERSTGHMGAGRAARSVASLGPSDAERAEL